MATEQQSNPNSLAQKQRLRSRAYTEALGPRWPFELQMLRIEENGGPQKRSSVVPLYIRKSCVPGPPGAGLTYPNLTNGEPGRNGQETHTHTHTHTTENGGNVGLEE